MTTTISRRSLLQVIATVSVLPTSALADRPGKHQDPARAKPTRQDPFGVGVDKAVVAAVAASYAAATSDPVEAESVAAWTTKGQVDATAIHAAAAKDFTDGRLFEHAGWRLSHTEGRLFTLLARTA